MDFSQLKVMIGLSGGINSMAVLCWLGNLPEPQRPKELHLFYVHFIEHSDDTNQFVLDGVFWARSRFEKVLFNQTDNSVMEYFEEENFIPHPMFSPCSEDLKIKPMLKYAYQHSVQVDLIGYVDKELKRLKRATKKGVVDLFFNKQFPIIGRSDEWCFQIVDENIGWHPKIYDIKDEKGNRIFKHNNCLPCKNMTSKQLEQTRIHFPEKYERAMKAQEKTGSYFGRSKSETGCSRCAFD